MPSIAFPLAGPFTFSFFDDFGIDAALNQGQLKQSPEGFATLTAPLYGCPVYNNGACQGGIPARRLDSSRISGPSPAPTLFRACLSAAKLRCIMPVVNAPFRLFYAYNPLRLYETAILQRCDHRRQSNPVARQS